MRMTVRTLAIALFMALGVLGAQTAKAPASAGPSVKLPSYKKLVLKNGLSVLLMEQHKVPLVSLHYIVRGGSASDPVGKEGLASLTAGLLRKGTKTRNAEQVAEALDSVGATYGAFAEADYCSGRAEFMKKDIAAGLELVADLLMNPSFPEAEVKKAVAQRVDGIRAAKDSAQGVIQAYFSAHLYGNHPYGKPQAGDEKSLAGLTRDDIVKYHAEAFQPGRTILVVVGDFTAPEMEKLLKERFETWKPAAKALASELPEPRKQEGRRLLLVDKPDATQTFFLIGSLGVARNHPDRVPLDVVNVLFGGRFTSMINTALRIKSGLTYGANATFDKRKVAGPFAISSYTANATTEKALDLALETLRSLHEKGITEEELASAKAYIKGTLPPRMLETSDQLAELLAEMQFYGLPDADVNEFYAKVDAMTLADAKRVIAAHYPSKDLDFVLIGKASELKELVKKYATEISTKSISDPGF